MTRLTYKEKSRSLALILFLLILLAVALSSCGVNHHLRKSQKHLKKAIQKGAIVTADTVWNTIEVPVPMVKTDTIVKAIEGDTVTIVNDKLKIRYVKLPADSVYIEGECSADTVKVEVPVTIVKEIKTPRGFWYYLKWFALALVVGFAAGFIFSAALRTWLKTIL